MNPAGHLRMIARREGGKKTSGDLESHKQSHTSRVTQANEWLEVFPFMHTPHTYTPPHTWIQFSSVRLVHPLYGRPRWRMMGCDRFPRSCTCRAMPPCGPV